MNQIKQKTDYILVTALVLSVFFGASISFGFRVMGIVITLFRFAIPLLFAAFVYRAYNKKRLSFESLEKSFLLLLLIWFLYAIFLMFFRGFVSDKDAIRELLQLVLQFFVAASVLLAIKVEGMEEKIIQICKFSIVVLSAIGIFEIMTGIHLPTSSYFNVSAMANSTSNSPSVATGIFFNENDYCACLALFSPLFFPQVGKNLSVNILRMIELSLMEFILLKDDAIICLFGIFLGLVFYSVFATVKYRWLIAGGIYAFVLEKTIMAFSLKRGAGKGLGSEVKEQFSGVNTQTGSAYVRMHTYIKEFTHSISEAKGLGFGPYGVNKFLTPFDHDYVLSNPHSLWLELIANYGVLIFVFFVTICLLSLGVLIVCGDRKDPIRAVLISMDVIFVIVGFASSNYIGIAYWWILIALSVGYSSKLLISSGIKIKKKYVIASVVSLLCLIAVSYKLLSSSSIMFKFQEPLKSSFETEEEYNFNRLTEKHVDKVKIVIDGKEVECFDVKNGEFSYKMDLAGLSEGWHQYRYEYYTGDGKNAGHELILVNKVNSKASVLIPEEDALKARYFNRTAMVEPLDFYLDKKAANKPYSALGAYWMPNEMTHKNVDEEVKLDKNGVPKIVSGENHFEYDPELIASYALMWYSDSLLNKNADSEKNFISCSKWLMDNQKSDGSIPMLLGRRYREETINKGWISANVQGMVLSVFSRAYAVTGDESYIKAGDKALKYMTDNCLKEYDADTNRNSKLLSYLTEEGNFSYYEDISGQEAHFRLDTQLYVLIGLYDWKMIDADDSNKELASKKFDEEVSMLSRTVALYDLNGYLSGDLMHISDRKLIGLDVDDKFAKIIPMLKAVSEISGNDEITKAYEKYNSFTKDKFYKQSDELIHK